MIYRVSSCRLVLIGLAFLCLFAAPGQAKAECALRVGWDEWPPYFTYQDGNFSGLEYDLLKSTAKTAGCSIDLQQVPWVRALEMLKSGTLDLLYGAGYSAERAAFAKYSIPYRDEQFVLVTKGASDRRNSSISLERWIKSEDGKKSHHDLGVFRGNVYGEKIDPILKQNIKNVVLVDVNDNDQMVNMLQAGRLDGYIVEDGVAQMLIRAAAFPMRRFLIEEQKGDPLHYIFTLKTPDDIIQRFNAAILKRQAETK
jgi:polar amino acid transport system substrate-binding protein